jgi:hypothetical protein
MSRRTFTSRSVDIQTSVWLFLKQNSGKTMDLHENGEKFTIKLSTRILSLWSSRRARVRKRSSLLGSMDWIGEEDILVLIT